MTIFATFMLAAGQIALARAPVSPNGDTVPGWPSAVALRLVGDGYRVVSHSDDAAVTLACSGPRGGVELVGRTFGKSTSIAVPAGSDAMLAFELAQQSALLVADLGGEIDARTDGIPQGVVLRIAGGDALGRGAINEQLARSLLARGLTLAPRGRPGDVYVCVALHVKEGSLALAEHDMLEGREGEEVVRFGGHRVLGNTRRHLRGLGEGAVPRLEDPRAPHRRGTPALGAGETTRPPPSSQSRGNPATGPSALLHALGHSGRSS